MINLLYCGNTKVFDGIMISAMSAAKKTSSPLSVYILTMDLTDIDERFIPISRAQSDYIEGVVRESNDESRVYLIDASDIFRAQMLDSVNLGSSYTPYTLLRLFADESEEIPDKIIYLDADTMAHGDIKELFDIDVGGYEFAGALDHLGKFFINRYYMNAGVLLLNMKEIRNTGLFKKARELCRTKKMSFPDQDALNKLSDRKLYIDKRFNSQRRLYDDTVIQHFSKSIRWFPFFHTINVKPWEVQKVHDKLKINAYDDVLDEYIRRRNELDNAAKEAGQ